MKVHELMEILQKLPGDLHIIISMDAEGNEYKDIECVDDDFSFFEGEGRFLEPVQSDSDSDTSVSSKSSTDILTRKCIIIYPV